MRRALSRRARVFGVVALAAAVIVVAMFADLAPAGAATSTATLNPGQIGSAGTSYSTDCSQGSGWVFVLPNSQGDSFVSLSATFENAGTVSGVVDSSNPKFATVLVPIGDTILSATAQINGGSAGSTFNVTHVCGEGFPSTTTTTVASATTSTASVPPTTTTTLAPTTTTFGEQASTSTLPRATTTTTVASTTTTLGEQGSSSTTTEQPTTTTLAEQGSTSTTTEQPTTTTSIAVSPSTAEVSTTTITIPASTTTLGPLGSTSTSIAALGSTTPTSSATVATATTSLPFTGSDTLPLTAGLASVMLGGLFTIVGRRHRRTRRA